MGFEYLFFHIAPVVFALAGLILAGYIFITKSRQTKLVCPIGGHCDTVVNSRYSKFAGIPVELAGVLYYTFIALVYSLSFFFPQMFSVEAKFFITAFTVAAFFFSVYLVFIQAFVIKNWCTWCLFSAGFSTIIFVTAVFGADFELIPLLAEYKGVIVFFHALAAAIGVGAATVTDIFFFKFLKDYRISENEKSVMDTLSNVIWIALGVLIITGIGLYLPRGEELLQSSKFITKMIAVIVVTINGFFLNVVISPKLTSIQFGKDHDHRDGELHVMRKLSFALGAISISSWYVIFLLGSLRSIPISSKAGIVVYVCIVFIAIVLSQAYDHILIKKRKKEAEGVKMIHIEKK